MNLLQRTIHLISQESNNRLGEEPGLFYMLFIYKESQLAVILN